VPGSDLDPHPRRSGLRSVRPPRDFPGTAAATSGSPREVRPVGRPEGSTRRERPPRATSTLTSDRLGEVGQAALHQRRPRS
jgi:hypothetical protein